jgi:hypothetical protein
LQEIQKDIAADPKRAGEALAAAYQIQLKKRGDSERGSGNDVSELAAKAMNGAFFTYRIVDAIKPLRDKGYKVEEVQSDMIRPPNTPSKKAPPLEDEPEQIPKQKGPRP